MAEFASCVKCKLGLKRNGIDRHGLQRFQCLNCRVTFGQSVAKTRYKQDKYLMAIEAFRAGGSIRKVAKTVGICERTSLMWRQSVPDLQFVNCQCGKNARHQGWCHFRFIQSDSRQDWHKKWCARHAGSGKPRPPKNPRYTYVYPYIVGSATEEHELLLLVNNAVSKQLPPEIRSDICQDILVALLAGDIGIDDLQKAVKDYTKRFWKEFGRKFGALSLDQPLPGGDSDTPLRDLIADRKTMVPFDEVPFNEMRIA